MNVLIEDKVAMTVVEDGVGWMVWDRRAHSYSPYRGSRVIRWNSGEYACEVDGKTPQDDATPCIHVRAVREASTS